MLYVPLKFDKYENHAQFDFGSFQSAMSEAELRKKLTTHRGYSSSTFSQTSKCKLQTEL